MTRGRQVRRPGAREVRKQPDQSGRRQRVDELHKRLWEAHAAAGRGDHKAWLDWQATGVELYLLLHPEAAADRVAAPDDIPSTKEEWQRRADAVERANAAIAAQWRADPRSWTPGHEQAAPAWFHEMLRQMYPPAFTESLRLLRSGDAGALEVAVSFLEADPRAFRSGYVKADILRRLKRVHLSAEHRQRLESVIVAVVDRAATPREFRDYCRLARSLGSDRLRAELVLRLESSDVVVRRHARWVLDAMVRGDRDRTGPTSTTGPRTPDGPG